MIFYLRTPPHFDEPTLLFKLDFLTLVNQFFNISL